MTAQADPPATGEAGNTGEEGPDKTLNIRRIEWLNLLLVVAAAGLALLHSRATALGVVWGGAIMAVSFRIIAAVMDSVFGRAKKRAWLMVVYWLKFAVMMSLIGVLIIKFDVDAMGLLFGLSMIVVSIVVETLRTLKQQQ